MLYLDALVALRHSFGKRLPLTVAGDGPLRPLAEKYVRAQALSVQFVGAVPDPMPLLAQASFAFVSGYLAIWQALASKRLVFAVYENELKRDYLITFPKVDKVLTIANDPRDLASRLNQHLSDPHAGNEMRERGAQAAAENSWDRVADLYLEMYRAHGLD